jgi:dipeptidyl aminopeptidase/acylaminoacyl peptidase
VSPDWSPDGERIVFATPSSIRTVGVNGKSEQVLFTCRDRFDGCFYSKPVWSPDGAKIAFRDDQELVVARADGSGAVQLGSGSGPAWSPDGTKLAFWQGGEFPLPPSIWVMNADGSDRRRLADGWGPAWSSDGWIAFQHSGDAEGADDEELYVIRPDGTGQRQITDDQVDDSQPDWSPDGSRLAFVRSPRRQPADEIYVVNADGTGERRITTTRSRVTHFPVEVRNARSGTLVSRFVPRGSAIDVAISQRYGATITRGSRGRTSVEVFRTASGARLGSVSVPRGANSISITSRTVVFASGHKIWALDAVRRKPSVIAIASERPIDLSIEGRRVAWAESTRERSRIRAVRLPASH